MFTRNFSSGVGLTQPIGANPAAITNLPVPAEDPTEMPHGSDTTFDEMPVLA